MVSNIPFKFNSHRYTVIASAEESVDWWRGLKRRALIGGEA